MTEVQCKGSNALPSPVHTTLKEKRPLYENEYISDIFRYLNTNCKYYFSTNNSC